VLEEGGAIMIVKAELLAISLVFAFLGAIVVGVIPSR
jgi:hypothetical protein